MLFQTAAGLLFVALATNANGRSVSLAGAKERRFVRTIPQGETVYTFPDGWTVQRLATPRLVETEGYAMQNCMKDDPLDYACADDDGNESMSDMGPEVFSLRDPKGAPHVSMQWDEMEGRFIEIRGKQNKPVHPKYREHLKSFVHYMRRRT